MFRIVIVAALGVSFSTGVIARDDPPPRTPLTVEEKAVFAAECKPLVEKAKAAVLDVMRDPDSAKFSHFWLEVSRQNQVGTVCGRVNGKNAYGGMTGKMALYYNVDKKKVMIGSENRNDIDSVIANAVCLEPGPSDVICETEESASATASPSTQP